MVRITSRRTAARLAGALLLAAGLSATAVAPQATAGAEAERPQYPVPYSLAGGFFADPAGGLDPEAAPPGANDWDCKPSAEHPEPVILLHGLGGNQRLNWSTTAPLLANNGYCVYSLTYGNHDNLPIGGLESMRDSAQAVSALVDKALQQTGAKKAAIVGHSEGSTVGAYYLKRLGGAAKVDKLVGISPNYQGTELYGLTRLAQNLPPGLDDILETACGACKEYARDSAFMKDLNAGGSAAVPGVTYTNIQGAFEQIVLPNSSGTLAVPNATNTRVNKGCAADLSDHISLVASRRANQMVLNALDPAHPGELPCAFNPPFLN
ncbi:alpha/beta fold hydrolase [Streptomyces sp. A7024]|uniref:Alpha/beta fold hydrolase n=1 Tax=Streptomyces coryli TaxID=1128680 RepID=A0A6G4UAS2_9ACTN|nr:alpha/beta fold hydrolase [Streptomyces coryli]NGN68291.1 alpha/beta fold hydrolase [Streptomyces coryli]